MKDCCVLVPCYNEEKTIKKIIQKLKYYHYNFLIINDGSTDNSLNIIKKETSNYLTYSTNQGKGFAIKKAIKYLKFKNYNWFAICDSDGQSNISNIAKVFKLRQVYPKAKILMGNRLNDPLNMSFIRLLANKIMSWVISILIGQRIPDSQCWLKIVRKDVFNNVEIKSNRFDYESELLIKAGRKGYEIVSGNIDCIYFKGRKSKMHPIKDALRFIKLIIRLLICY